MSRSSLFRSFPKVVARAESSENCRMKVVSDDADDILTVSTTNKKEIAKAREHHKSRLAGTIRQIKKVLQRSQYRKAVEALCSQNKNVFGTVLPACISRNTCCQKLRTESKYARITYQRLFTDCKL
ncbi:TPA: hypothetical protein H2X12_003688 [Salmonella enterica]|nr:hypothetical protein [Salmonella enterica]